jgi:sialic acid synthase SpsE
MVQIIAEAGISHLGSLTKARQLADWARQAGVQTVKFQTYLPAKLVRKTHHEARQLEKWALSFADTVKLAQHCEDIGIEFMSTPGDVDSLRFLIEECGVKRIKIGSDDLTYEPLVHAAYRSGKPVLLSTGMATMAEISHALPWKVGIPVDLTLMHCTSLYPCPNDKTNLRAITTLSKFGCPVGFSDHTFMFTAACLSLALGATVIEKHFCPGNGYSGPDLAVSLSPQELTQFVKVIKLHEIMLGSGIKEPCPEEIENAKNWRKDSDGLRRG